MAFIRAVKACLLAVCIVEPLIVFTVLGAGAIPIDSISVVGARDARSLHETAGPVRIGPARALHACFGRGITEPASC